MWDRALEWAKQNGHHRTHPVHGEDEVRMVLSETFSLKEQEEESVTRQGSFAVEVGSNSVSSPTISQHSKRF